MLDCAMDVRLFSAALLIVGDGGRNLVVSFAFKAKCKQLMRKSSVQKDMSSAVWQQNGDGERPKQYFANALMWRCEQKGDPVQTRAVPSV